LVIETTKS